MEIVKNCRKSEEVTHQNLSPPENILQGTSVTLGGDLRPKDKTLFQLWDT